MEQVGISTPIPFCTGSGTEESPYRSVDGTAGIETALGVLCARGGRLLLPNARYDIQKTIQLTLSSTKIEGEIWNYSSDPNGVFESPYGTKIRLNGTGYPAFLIGRDTMVGGSMITDVGVCGDYQGMDTRGLFDFAHPAASAGMAFTSVRVDQAEFDKMSFCGLGTAIAACENAELDACCFSRINTDGCCVGIYFSPAKTYYVRFMRIVVADTPQWGFFGDGRGKQNYIMEIQNTHFVRNSGALPAGAEFPAAVALVGISLATVRDCVFDAPGIFWYYEPDARENRDHRVISAPVDALPVIGDQNRVMGNIFQHSSAASIRVQGSGNTLMQNVVDGDVVLEGSENEVCGLRFTTPEARLILKGAAAETTTVFGVAGARIVKLPA